MDKRNVVLNNEGEDDFQQLFDSDQTLGVSENPKGLFPEKGLLHPHTLAIFRRDPDDPSSPPIDPYRHQTEAIRRILLPSPSQEKGEDQRDPPPHPNPLPCRERGKERRRGDGQRPHHRPVHRRHRL